jgi:hypothetical protein
MLVFLGFKMAMSGSVLHQAGWLCQNVASNENNKLSMLSSGVRLGGCGGTVKRHGCVCQVYCTYISVMRAFFSFDNFICRGCYKINTIQCLFWCTLIGQIQKNIQLIMQTLNRRKFGNL